VATAAAGAEAVAAVGAKSVAAVGANATAVGAFSPCSTSPTMDEGVGRRVAEAGSSSDGDTSASRPHASASMSPGCSPRFESDGLILGMSYGPEMPTKRRSGGREEASLRWRMIRSKTIALKCAPALWPTRVMSSGLPPRVEACS
jgi:hypothetical protein